MRCNFNNSCCNIFKEVIRFIAYVLVAVYLTNWYQVRNSERDEAQKIINATSHLIMKRMYELERVIYALKSNNLRKAELLFGNYEEDAISEWNINSILYYHQISKYFNKKVAENLTCINEDPTSASLFYYFRKAHDSVKEWKSCLKTNNISHCESQKINSENTINIALKHSVDYIQELNDEYYNKFIASDSFALIYDQNSGDGLAVIF